MDRHVYNFVHPITVKPKNWFPSTFSSRCIWGEFLVLVFDCQKGMTLLGDQIVILMCDWLCLDLYYIHRILVPRCPSKSSSPNPSLQVWINSSKMLREQLQISWKGWVMDEQWEWVNKQKNSFLCDKEFISHNLQLIFY